VVGDDAGGRLRGGHGVKRQAGGGRRPGGRGVCGGGGALSAVPQRAGAERVISGSLKVGDDGGFEEVCYEDVSAVPGDAAVPLRGRAACVGGRQVGWVGRVGWGSRWGGAKSWCGEGGGKGCFREIGSGGKRGKGKAEDNEEEEARESLV